MDSDLLSGAKTANKGRGVLLRTLSLSLCQQQREGDDEGVGAEGWVVEEGGVSLFDLEDAVEWGGEGWGGRERAPLMRVYDEDKFVGLLGGSSEVNT